MDRYAFTQGKINKFGIFAKAVKRHSALVALRTSTIKSRLRSAIGSNNLNRVHFCSAHNYQPGNKRGDNWQEALAHVQVARVFMAPNPCTNLFRFRQTGRHRAQPKPDNKPDAKPITACFFCRDLGLASCYTPYLEAVKKGYVKTTIQRLQLATTPELAREKLRRVLVAWAIVTNGHQAKCLVLAAFYLIRAFKV